MLQRVIDHVPAKGSAGTEQGCVSEFGRHVLDPFVMLFRFVSAHFGGSISWGTYFGVGGVCGVAWVLCLLGHGAGVELLRWVGVVAWIDVV